jgi:hypothetical protein
MSGHYKVEVKASERMYLSLENPDVNMPTAKGWDAALYFVNDDGTRRHVRSVGQYKTKAGAKRVIDGIADEYRRVFKTTGFRREVVEAEKRARKEHERLTGILGTHAAASIAKLPDDLREEAAHNVRARPWT